MIVIIYNYVSMETIMRKQLIVTVIWIFSIMNILKGTARRIKKRFAWPARFNSWTLISKFTLVCIGIIMLQNNLYGLLACRYSVKRRKFILSHSLVIYCFCVSGTFAIFYLRLIWTEYIDGHIDSRDAIKIYSYMNVFVALLNYVTQWAMMRQILHFLNNLPLFSTINYFTISFSSVGNAVMLAVLKMFGFTFLMQLTLLLYQKHKYPDSTWIQTSAIIFPIVLGNQINNCFFSAMVISRVLLMQINKQLREILLQVNQLQTPADLLFQKSYFRMQRFCDLADHLDELAIKYTLVTSLSNRYLQITSSSLVISMGVNLFSTTLGFYTQYQALADYIMTEESYDVARALANLVFLAVPLLEIVLLAQISQEIIQEVSDFHFSKTILKM